MIGMAIPIKIFRDEPRQLIGGEHEPETYLRYLSWAPAE